MCSVTCVCVCHCIVRLHILICSFHSDLSGDVCHATLQEIKDGMWSAAVYNVHQYTGMNNIKTQNTGQHRAESVPRCRVLATLHNT